MNVSFLFHQGGRVTLSISRFFAAAGAVGLSLSCLSQAASASMVETAPVLFGFVGMGYPDHSKTEDKVRSVTETVSLSMGDVAATAASVEVNYGSLGYRTYQSSSDGTVGWAGGLWADGFTFSGGTGSTMVDVSTLVRGASQGDMSYTVYLSRTPFTAAQFDALAASPVLSPDMPGAQTLLSYTIDHGVGVGALNQRGSFSANFGESVYILAYLNAEGKQADFSDPLVFRMNLAPGVAYQSLSGTTYAAAAVPEPASATLLTAGLLAAGAVASRRRMR